MQRILGVEPVAVHLTQANAEEPPGVPEPQRPEGLLLTTVDGVKE
jgi:hypothetical protein